MASETLDRPTDQHSNQPTDQQTDMRAHREVALPIIENYEPEAPSGGALSPG